MFHTSFVSHADSYGDFAVYGIDQTDYLDINNIEPSLFPATCGIRNGGIAECAMELPAECGSSSSNVEWNNWNTAAMPTQSAKIEVNEQKPKCGGKVVRKRKTKKDPNEPQKPVSAYALFFRDTQATIKGRTPNATFGEVSKLVASMWDSLDGGAKNSYKQKTESAKREYLKRLAAYRASQISQPSGAEGQEGGDHMKECAITSPEPLVSSTEVGSMSLASLIAMPPAKQGINPSTNLPMRTHNDYVNNNEWNARYPVLPSMTTEFM